MSDLNGAGYGVKTTIRSNARRQPRHRRILAVLAVGASFLSLPLGLPVLAQEVQLVQVNVQTVAKGYRMSKLSGHAVVNDKNENIGKIDDFVIGRDEAHSLFTILQVGGFLGIGSRFVAVPFDSLQVDKDGNKVELPGASKQELQSMAEFRYGS
jgi:sporulation protein YlmC with PRC-barrel domain